MTESPKPAASSERRRAEARSLYPASPCIDICTLDDDDRCLGCGRSLDQITRWTLMSKEEQWSVIDELAAREGSN